MNQLKSGKATGGCGIYAEMLVAGRASQAVALLLLRTLLCSIWNTGIIPTDWRRGVVFPIWKGKDDTQECYNYRGGLHSFVCQARSCHESSLIGSGSKCCYLTSAMSSLVSRPKSLL